MDLLHFYTLQEFSEYIQSSQHEENQQQVQVEEDTAIFSCSCHSIYMFFEVYGNVYINKTTIDFEGDIIHNLGRYMHFHFVDN